MALSTATKAGLGGIGTVSVGAPTTYLVYDKYFSDSLYEVEREVINKDLKLTAETPSDNKITISVPINEAGKTDASKLAVGNKWFCVVTISGENANNEATTIQKELEGRFLLLNKEQKVDLVEACSKIKNKASKHEVEGTLKLNVVNGSDSSKSYKFKDHNELDYLLDFFFKEVEWEVISKNVTLEVSDPKPASNNKVEIKAEANTGSESVSDNKLTKEHEWSCEITVTSSINGSDATAEATALKTSLSSKISSLNQEDKLQLVKACAKNRDSTGLTETKVKGKLAVTVNGSTSSRSYSPKDGLNFLFK